MTKWKIELYDGVEKELTSMPPKLQARMIKLLDLITHHGANLGEPYTKAMGSGLFEIRAKSNDGIGRGLFCYLKGTNIVVLHVFVKKSMKTPKHDLDLALNRMKEVKKS
ncbi:type II toxin-antitoxin system RelE/ParE family toxin [Photobacterium phosphoreum]|uniref:type II toxin-antitoxin system RelE/ParE family toxin n=1 Tax=Photobacterium phosphoreum TaxID=659 RepID=UPI000D16B6BE|nr:type II toxin-antitoxin system RelE/ParE family toxin [Photobacterium phosphoreum]PSW30855.1 type II toxin-antitoxin system RelE/ParE family toxin [Photobacterium phosphoreum]